MYACHKAFLLLCGIAFSKRVLDSKPPVGNEGLLNADREVVAEGDADVHMEEADTYPKAGTSDSNEVTFSAMEVKSGENDAVPREENMAGGTRRGQGRRGGIGAQHTNIVANAQSKAAANKKEVQSVLKQTQSKLGASASKNPLSNKKEMKLGEENEKSKGGASESNKAMSNEREVKSGDKQGKSKPGVSSSKVSTSKEGEVNEGHMKSGEKTKKSKNGVGVSKINISNVKGGKSGDNQNKSKLVAHEGDVKTEMGGNMSKLEAITSNVTKLTFPKPAPCFICKTRWFSGDRALEEHITSEHADKPSRPDAPVESKGCWVYTNDFLDRNRTTFGYFHCACDRRSNRSWKSAFAWKRFRQRCQGCQRWNRPYFLWVNEAKETGDYKRNKSKQPHDRDGCEACRKFGMPCWEYSSSEGSTWRGRYS